MSTSDGEAAAESVFYSAAYRIANWTCRLSLRPRFLTEFAQPIEAKERRYIENTDVGFVTWIGDSISWPNNWDGVTKQ